MTIKDYYEQLESNILDNLQDMDTFWKTYNLPWLNYWKKKKIEDLNRLITSEETESVIKNLPQKW